MSETSKPQGVSKRPDVSERDRAGSEDWISDREFTFILVVVAGFWACVFTIFGYVVWIVLT